ncbi:MAG TPA: hypothetical protein VFH08_19220, partial [Chitinophagaceae bacterium]|nr:hypothetical protein [Chitinophagaceae bacterium]
MNPKFFFIKTLFFFSGLLSLKNASSQTVFSGYIKNKQGAPVSFATVKLKRDTIQPQAIAYCIATDEGYFDLQCPATLKTAFIEISAVGYHTLFIYLPKIEGAEQRLSPVLEEDTKPLPEIYLKADLPIQVSGDTVTFKVEAFKHGDETNIVKLLSKMPGFTILENGKLAFNGEPITKVLLDNDDLTGAKYEELINTLSPSGIQKIQVFKNYKDPENIASQILNSNTQVLNLKYGDKFKGKVLGNVQAAVGLPLKYYDENAQLVSLIPKSKAVGIFNVNSVGELNENNTSSNSVSNDDNQEIADISSMANESLAEIKDLTLGSFRQRPIRNNNSGQGIVNFYFRPNKKLILKGSTALFKDNYSQDVAVINNMYTPLQQIIQLQNKEISKNNNNFYQLFSVNYLINKRNQIAAVIKYDNAGINAHEFGLLNNEPFEGRLKGRDKQFNWKITYNHIFPSGSIFTFIFLNKKSRLPNYYFFTPSYYDTLFYSSSLYKYNEQNELQTFSQLSSLLSYIKKGRKSSIVFNLSATKNTTSLFNTLYVYNNPESKILINNALTNNIRLNDNKISLNIQETLNLNRALSLTVGAELELRRQRISDRENNSVFESLNKFSALPVISGSWDLKGQNRISFNYRMQNTTPMLRNLSEGYVLTGNTGLYKGFSTLQVQSTPFLQVSFAHMDLLRKGILLFTGFHLLRSPLFLLADQYPNFYYTFWQYQPTTKELP